MEKVKKIDAVLTLMVFTSRVSSSKVFLWAKHLNKKRTVVGWHR